ncbi:MAG: helix-turn-helix domain-containing protein [Candidatus Sericytochromatia bacterium]|nr:helix-turn-helix domain-containing protein [Candidatus Sericytochromatia bacterium]
MTDVCQLLRETRLSKGLTLDEVAQRTYIKLHYLEALEEGRMDRLPAMVHTYGYIRQYAKLLGLDGGALVAQFQQFEKAAEAPRSDRPGLPETVADGLAFLRPLKPTAAEGELPSGGSESPPMLDFPALTNPSASTRQLRAASAPVQDSFPAPTLPAPLLAKMPGDVPSATSSPTLDLMEARAQAQQIVLAAEREARQLVRGAEGYADEVLGQLEAEVGSVLQIIQNGRNFLAARRRQAPVGHERGLR